jgi:hypothetical protein
LLQCGGQRALNRVDPLSIGDRRREQHIGAGVLVHHLNIQSADAGTQPTVDAAGNGEGRRWLHVQRCVDGSSRSAVDDAAGRQRVLLLELLNRHERGRAEERAGAFIVGSNKTKLRQVGVKQARVVAREALLEVSSLEIHVRLPRLSYTVLNSFRCRRSRD